MSLVRLNRVSKTIGDHPILRDVSLKIDAGERVALVGRNGSGKTTVLKLILGLESTTDGTSEHNIGVRLGYFSQSSELSGVQSVLEVLQGLFDDVRQIESELAEIAGILEGAEDSTDIERLIGRQSDLFDAMNCRDGWEYQRHIDTVLTKLGFNSVRRSLPTDQLSGGWRNRASLAKLLLETPDVLLLDEPTNFLDVDGVAWLETWLKSYKGAALIVSHDREFIDATASRVVEIENYRLHEYAGNYSQYIRTKQFRIKSLERQFEHEEELLVLESEAFSDRQDVLQSSDETARRKLADIKKRRPPRPVQMIVTDVYAGLRVPDNLVSVQELSAGFMEEKLFEDVSFEIRKGDKLSIVGPNGCGKSTLLKVLTEQLKPSSGQVIWERGVSFADFNAIQQSLDPKDTVTHAVNTFGMGVEATRKQVNRFLGLLNFSEMDVQQRIGTLSGGQQSRVALAKCLLSGASVLILDEPTNHLDLTSIQIMEQALIQFPGAVIVVSHDRFFIDRISNRLLMFDGASVRSFHGTWDEYSRTP